MMTSTYFRGRSSIIVKIGAPDIIQHSKFWQHTICWELWGDEVLVKVGQDARIWPSTAPPFMILKYVSKFPFHYLSPNSKRRKMKYIFSSEVFLRSSKWFLLRLPLPKHMGRKTSWLRFIYKAKQRKVKILFAENHLSESRMHFRLDIYWLADPPHCRSRSLSHSLSWFPSTTRQPPSVLSDRPWLSHAFTLTLEILLHRPGARPDGNTSFESPPSSFVLSSPAAHMRARANKHTVGKKKQKTGDPSSLGNVRGGALWINDRLMLRWKVKKVSEKSAS